MWKEGSDVVFAVRVLVLFHQPCPVGDVFSRRPLDLVDKQCDLSAEKSIDIVIVLAVAAGLVVA